VQRRATLQTEVERGLAYAMNPRLAPLYERHMVDDCHYRTPGIVADALVRFARPRGRWLDLGAGTGLLGKALSARSAAVELVAIDLSRAMLDRIEGSIYVARHVADATLALPFARGSFDGVVSAGLLEHVVRPRALMTNAVSVTKSGGAVLFTYLPNRSGYSERCPHQEGLVSHDVDSMRAEVERAGLSLVHEAEFPAYLIASRGWVVHHLMVGLRSSPHGSATT
jgi:predicted TPR repeat methyltransferase